MIRRPLIDCTLVLALISACGIPHDQYQAQLAANRVLAHQLELERGQRAVLEARLLELSVQRDLLDYERQALAFSLEADGLLLGEAEAARERLEELETLLTERQRELTRLTELTRQSERASDTWYNAALERARRATRQAGGSE